MELLTAQEMRSWEEETVRRGRGEELLMEVAGFQVARVVEGLLLRGRVPEGGGLEILLGSGTAEPRGRGPVVVLEGPGKNGGDGRVAARYLRAWGWEVRELAPGEEGLGEALAGASLVVDALLGTGTRGAPRGPVAEALERLEEVRCPVVAVDLPSGVDPDTGAVPGPAAFASLTVTMHRPKLGLLFSPGWERVGSLVRAELPILSGEHSFQLLLAREVAALLPPRPREAHKHRFGHVAVVAGGRGYAGAAWLAAEAGLRSGAGLVTLLAPEGVARLDLPRPEVMVRPLPEDEDGFLSAEAAGEILRFLDQGRVSALAVGPGLGRTPGVQEVVSRILERWEGPLVLDADGLNVSSLELLSRARGSLVITPHPGELARLMALSPALVQEDRLGAVRRVAAETGAVSVLKGFRTLVASPEGKVWVNPTGNEGLATAGTGDVLTGLLAGLSAQGAPPLSAALAGVYIHGLAGDLAVGPGSARSLMACDVLRFVGEAFARVEGRKGC